MFITVLKLPRIIFGILMEFCENGDLQFKVTRQKFKLQIEKNHS